VRRFQRSGDGKSKKKSEVFYGHLRLSSGSSRLLTQTTSEQAPLIKPQRILCGFYRSAAPSHPHETSFLGGPVFYARYALQYNKTYARSHAPPYPRKAALRMGSIYPIKLKFWLFRGPLLEPMVRSVNRPSRSRLKHG
jgi:hypothetical protein